MTFVTEKETEELLQIETRDLPMPDGTIQPYTGFHIMWNSLDYLIGNYDLELEWFVKMASTDAEEMDRTFEQAFRNTIAYVRQEYKKAFES